MAIYYKVPSAQELVTPQYPDGVDFSTFVDGSTPDLDPNWRPIPGPRAVAEKILRRWIGVPGEYHNSAIGARLMTYLNAGLSPLDVSALQAELKSQAIGVEGLEDIDVRVTGPDAAGNVDVRANMKLSSGRRYDMVFRLSAVSIPKITLLGPNAF